MSTVNIDCTVCKAVATLTYAERGDLRPQVLAFLVAHQPCMGGRATKVTLVGETPDGKREVATFSTKGGR